MLKRYKRYNGCSSDGVDGRFNLVTLLTNHYEGAATDL